MVISGCWVLQKNSITIYEKQNFLNDIRVNEHPEEKTWWINELNSLGVNKDNNNEELQTLENLTDDVNKCSFTNIRRATVRAARQSQGIRYYLYLLYFHIKSQ
jgi:hypothetical protein